MGIKGTSNHPQNMELLELHSCRFGGQWLRLSVRVIRMQINHSYRPARLSLPLPRLKASLSSVESPLSQPSIALFTPPEEPRSASSPSLSPPLSPALYLQGRTRRVPLQWVRKFQRGQETEVFKRHLQPARAFLSFSILYIDGCGARSRGSC